MDKDYKIISFNKEKDILIIEADFSASNIQIEQIRNKIFEQTNGKIPIDSILVLDKTMKAKGLIINE